MLSCKKFFLFFLLSQILLHGVTPRSHHHSGGTGLSSAIGSIFDDSSDDTPPPETNPNPPPTTSTTPSDLPDLTPEEAVELAGGTLPPLSEVEDDPMITELNEILEGQTEPESNISIENYPTNILDGSFTEYEQEGEWSTENEAYEFENGEIVGYGYVPIDLETANSDSTVQDALKFGNAFVIEGGVESGELASNEAQFQQLLAVSSRSLGTGTEYEFHVEINDAGAPEDSQSPQAFFTVFVETGSGRKGVTSYSILSRDFSGLL